ncbi:MAG: class I SAM-dependent methyltransferase [Planctomycetes bacterium]|nr:class I SAM-dependent methyltransferase [Planctomycetota bacterium]
MDLRSILVCPKCRCSLPLTDDVAVRGGSAVVCRKCAARFPALDGSIDFALEGSDENGAERSHYDRKYAAQRDERQAPFDAGAWHRRWHDRHWPECQVILRRLGDVRGKLILCIGNGSSVKELYLAHLGAHVIHSDLSITGVLQAKNAYSLEAFSERVAFHAFDAYRIPLADSSVDVVYGFEFVHHLPDLTGFLAEVRRVLKPGGFCLFLDAAYSPLWQGLKKTVLWPMMKLSHTLYRRSPEDLRATEIGGYKEAELSRMAEGLGLVNGQFDRMTFFHYILTHAVGGILGWRLPHMFYKAPGYVGRALDSTVTAVVPALRGSRIDMVWGFEKPGQ